MSRDELLAKLDEYLGPANWEDLPEGNCEEDGASVVT